MANAPMMIGLTGGIASGKSMVSQLFNELGVDIIDTDLLARECVAPGSQGLSEVVAHFGKDVLEVSGELDRSVLRAKVFTDETERLWLEACLHPKIRSLTADRIAQISSSYGIIVVPLLAENIEHYEYLGATVVVDCSEDTQLTRLMQRDSMSKVQAQKIIDSQATRAQRLAIATHVISNEDGAQEVDLSEKVADLHTVFTQMVSMSV